MADINVRLINGDSIVVHCPSDQINVKQLRLLLAQQKPNLASCQLFRNVGYLQQYFKYAIHAVECL